MSDRRQPPNSNNSKSQYRRPHRVPERSPVAKPGSAEQNLLKRPVRHNTRQNAQKKPEPTMAEAFVIFTKRIYKQINKSFKYKRLTGMVALAAVLIGLIVMTVIAASGKNAIAVYLEEEIIGYIARSDEVDEITVQSKAVSRREATLGMAVKVNETVHIKLTNVSRKRIQPNDDVIDEISRRFTFQIVAVSILVDGTEMAVMRSQSDARMVEARLQAPYRNEFTVDAEFVENWEYREKLVDEEHIGTTENALIKLDVKGKVMEDYVIRSGDTLGAIATRNNTTVDKICQDNPPMNANTIIRPGETIKLETVKPFLSVRTIDEITRTEPIPMQTEERLNPDEPVNYSMVIEEGRAGEQETTVRITRVNGIQIGAEEILTNRTTINPINRIVEVGTVEPQPNRR